MVNISGPSLFPMESADADEATAAARKTESFMMVRPFVEAEPVC